MGVILHKHFGLLNTHRRLQESFQLIKFAPRSTKGVQVYLSLQNQYLKQSGGRLQAFDCQRFRAKPGFSVDDKGGIVYAEQGRNCSVRGWVGNERTHITASAGEIPGGTGPCFLVASLEMRACNSTEPTNPKHLFQMNLNRHNCKWTSS